MGYNRLPSTAVYNAETTTVYNFDWTLDLDIILSTIDDTLYSVTLWKMVFWNPETLPTIKVQVVNHGTLGRAGPWDQIGQDLQPQQLKDQHHLVHGGHGLGVGHGVVLEQVFGVLELVTVLTVARVTATYCLP